MIETAITRPLHRATQGGRFLQWVSTCWTQFQSVLHPAETCQGIHFNQTLEQERIVANANMTATRLGAGAVSNLTSLASNDYLIGIAIHPESLLEIVKHGDRFKNVWEQPCKQDFYCERRQVAEGLMGYKSVASGVNRPYYGYLLPANPKQRDQHVQNISRYYGTCTMLLHPEVKKHATVSSQDSFRYALEAEDSSDNSSTDYECQFHGFSEARLSSFPTPEANEIEENLASINSAWNYQYTEVQIHVERIDASHVESVLCVEHAGSDDDLIQELEEMCAATKHEFVYL